MPESEATHLPSSHEPATRRSDESAGQIPVAAQLLAAQKLVSANEIRFAPPQPGLTWAEITSLQSTRQILAAQIQANAPFEAKDFRPARIGVILACRLKSGRLNKKGLLPVHGRPLIERCLENCLRIPGCQEVILATSTHPEDAELAHHTFDPAVRFERGDPEDVIARYLQICIKYELDVVVRATGDNPVISPEIAAYLLQSHFDSGADYTVPRKVATGNGCEIYNAEVYRRILAYFGRAEHSEYMSWYVKNNPEHFKINFVDLPAELVRDYRLTVDYEIDLTLFNRLFEKLDAAQLPATTANVFAILDREPELAALNTGITPVYKSNQELIQMLNEKTRMGSKDN